MHFEGSGMTCWAFARSTVPASADQQCNAFPQQALQLRLAGSRYLIVDEISMVSAATLQHVHRRMTEALGNNDPYGGVSMVFVGDFFQLPPGALLAHTQLFLGLTYSVSLHA